MAKELYVADENIRAGDTLIIEENTNLVRKLRQEDLRPKNIRDCYCPTCVGKKPARVDWDKLIQQQFKEVNLWLERGLTGEPLKSEFDLLIQLIEEYKEVETQE